MQTKKMQIIVNKNATCYKVNDVFCRPEDATILSKTQVAASKRKIVTG